jgi:hypothetical protein
MNLRHVGVVGRAALTISESVGFAFGMVQFSGSFSSLSVVARIPLEPRERTGADFCRSRSGTIDWDALVLGQSFCFQAPGKTMHDFRGQASDCTRV